MLNKLIAIIIIISSPFFVLGQESMQAGADRIYSEARYSLNSSKKRSETIYKYSNGKLCRVIWYNDNKIRAYKEILYNKLGNKESETKYNSHGEITNSKLLTYDSKQRLSGINKKNSKGELVETIVYDTLSRIDTIKFHDNRRACNTYYKYEYPRKNRIKKIYYIDCYLDSYELQKYDNYNNIVKSEFYDGGNLTNYTAYRYYKKMLFSETTYKVARDTQVVSDKRYIYNRNRELIEIIKDGKTIRTNEYENNRLIASTIMTPVVPHGGMLYRNRAIVIRYKYYKKRQYPIKCVKLISESAFFIA